MKLTKEHIGKKMRRSTWGMHSFFTPLARASNGNWIGECAEGRLDSYPEESSTWEFFEEPEEEIKLWSVWEMGGSKLVFISEKTADSFSLFTPIEFSTFTCQLINYPLFLKNYKPRPDLEVVAPFIERESSDSKLIIPLGLNPNYINNNSASMRWDVYKWPASLALCQIVEKKK